MKIFHKFNATKSGGRKLQGQSNEGFYRISIDPAADGRDCLIVNPDGDRVGKCRVDFKTPEATTPAPCRHLGDHIDDAECKSCSGTVRAKVFGCSVHGRCVATKTIEGAATCKGCGDYRASDGNAT